MAELTLADAVDRIEKIRASFTVRNHLLDQRLVSVIDTLLKMMPLSDLLREHAAAVHVDGTPAQVGMTAEEAAKWAERIRQTVDLQKTA